MIKVQNVVKQFGSFRALDGISFEIQDGSIYGLVGINGAGKSTLLRVITGIYTPEEGEVTFDGIKVYDNPEVKARIAFVPDELFLPNGMSMYKLAKKYENLYNGKFNFDKFYKLAGTFGLDIKKSVNTFSKGMRRQASTILAMALETDYIFFDETFDGLDPFKRAYIKKLISEDVKERNATAIITSHSLKELEDICDRLAVLDKGGLVFESDVATLEGAGLKIQVVFGEEFGIEKFEPLELEIVEFTKHGSVANLIVRGDKAEVEEKISSLSPLVLEMLPLTLEEVFTYELSKRGANAGLTDLLRGEDEINEENK